MSERDLWVAVIATAVLDLREASPTTRRTNERELIRAEAERWFGTSNFRRICIMADFDPDYVLGQIEKANKDWIYKALEARLVVKRDRDEELPLEE